MVEQEVWQKFEAFCCENGMMFDGMKNINFRDCRRDWKLQQYGNSRPLEPRNSKVLRFLAVGSYDNTIHILFLVVHAYAFKVGLLGDAMVSNGLIVKCGSLDDA
jgi:hypothetical protein